MFIKYRIIPVMIPTHSMLKSFNCFIIKTEENITLVDAAIDDDEAYDMFIKVLSENNLRVADITQIVLTHNHSDHTGFVRRIRQQTAVEVYAHPRAFLRLTRDINFLTKRVDFFGELYREHGTGQRGEEQVGRMRAGLIKNEHLRVDYPIKPIVEGDFINGFEVIEVPGHTVDHIALYNSMTGDFIAGDHVLEHAASNALVEMGLEGEMMQMIYLYEQSLKKCESLNIRTIYPGHGIIIDEEAGEIFKKRLNSIQRKSFRIKKSIEEKTQSAAELAISFYKGRYDKLFLLVMSEVIGHLERLVINDELVKEQREGIIYYQKNP